MLILPGHPLFQLTLDTCPPPGKHGDPFSGGVALVKDLDSGLLRPANETEMMDYVWGGELDEVEEKYGENDDDAGY